MGLEMQNGNSGHNNSIFFWRYAHIYIAKSDLPTKTMSNGIRRKYDGQFWINSSITYNYMNDGMIVEFRTSTQFFLQLTLCYICGHSYL